MLARRFAAPFGGGDLAYWLGMLHDVGKASCGWQEGLVRAARTRDRVGVDHKALGTQVAVERGLGRFGLGVWGHHGGLIDFASLRTPLRQRLADGAANVASALAELPGLLPELPPDLRGVVPELWHREPFVGEMAMRLCYSALVDADALDTAAFHASSAPRVSADADFGYLYDLFERRRVEELSRRPVSPVDKIRGQVYDECVAAAGRPRGMFRLAAPTGAGKTLAAAGFGLRHAALNGCRRVIVAVPFLTITEQNAAVYRRLLDEDGVDPVVLEHHSQANFDGSRAGRWGRLAAENWDAPFVVTTFVRLFESLYGRKPSAMRRVHRLAGAVIVLDEVQALPHDMLAPILDGLRLLVEHFGTTVVLSSATQPDFWALNEFAGFRAEDLVADVQGLADRLRRVRFDWQLDPSPMLVDVADQAARVEVDEPVPAGEPVPASSVEGGATAMVVVNTTADARTVFDRWRETRLPAWHLSTRMCPAHRRRVLDEVRGRLRDGLPVLLVSTQLIEAGVDVDFPLVFRAMAPADSLLQAAGRANRDGRLGLGRVVVFAPEDGGQPPSYKHLVGATRVHFGPKVADPDDLGALKGYYRSVYGALNLSDPGHRGQSIQQARRRWEFQTVTDGPLLDTNARLDGNRSKAVRDRRKAFRLIDEEGISVVTPQGAGTPEEQAEIEDLIAQIRAAPVPDMRQLRRLQPYTTTVHSSVLRRDPGVAALMRPILGTTVEVGALVQWRGDYDSATGIDFDPDVEGFVL